MESRDGGSAGYNAQEWAAAGIVAAGAVVVGTAASLGSRATLVVAVCALAAISAGRAGWRSKNVIWALASIIAVLMMSSTIIHHAVGDLDAAHPAWRAVQLAQFWSVAILVTVGFWIGSRPFLSWRSGRRAAHATAVGIVAGSVGVVLLDAR